MMLGKGDTPDSLHFGWGHGTRLHSRIRIQMPFRSRPSSWSLTCIPISAARAAGCHYLHTRCTVGAYIATEKGSLFSRRPVLAPLGSILIFIFAFDKRILMGVSDRSQNEKSK